MTGAVHAARPLHIEVDRPEPSVLACDSGSGALGREIVLALALMVQPEKAP